jgi:quercetin dioxygenase-like cupin family protein
MPGTCIGEAPGAPDNTPFEEFAMTTQGFVASHARDALFERGLRAFFEYRDLGIRQATDGRVVAHVIRAAGRTDISSQPHLHDTQFQFVYVLKGWIEFEYEGQGVVRLEAGSSVYQPPQIHHRELGHSADVELLEIVMPGDFGTREVDAVQPVAAGR